MYFFTYFLEQKYTTPGKNKSILPFYNFILLTELGAYRLKHMTEKQVLINKIRKERNKRNHSTEKEQPAIIQQIPLQRTSTHAYVTENEKAVKEPKGTTGRR